MLHRLTILGVLALLSLTPVRADDWPYFHHDAQRTGLSTEALPSHDLAVAWAVQIDDESVDTSPAIVGGQVFIGTATGKIVCVAADTGAKRWEVQTGGAVASSPAVAGGRVFAGSADRCLYALAASDGKLLWRVKTRRPVTAPPLCLGDAVYFGSGDGVFRCVGANDGTTRWEARETGEICAAAAAAEGRVYYGDDTGTVVARACTDGKLLWSVHLSGSIVAAPMLAGGKLVVPVMSGTALSPPPTQCITVLDPKSGQQLWALTRGSSVMQTPVADEQNVYFATVSGYLSDTELFAYRLADGTEAWKQKLGGVADSSPLLTGGCLMFGNHDRNFYVVDKASGAIIQTLPLGAKMYSSPALSNGSIYIGAQDGKLYCLR